MQTPEALYDDLLNHRATKSITRGSRQSADTAAMEAYWRAIDEGKTVDEAGEVFVRTYQKMINGKANHNINSL